MHSWALSSVHHLLTLASLSCTQIEMALLYPGHRYTLVRMRLRYFDLNFSIGVGDDCLT